MNRIESPFIFSILLCGAIFFAAFLLVNDTQEGVQDIAQATAGYAVYGANSVTGAASFGTSGFSTQDSAPTRKRFILIGIDGFQYNHFVTMRNAGNLTNFTRLMQRAGFNTTHNITGHTTPSTAPGWAEIHTGLDSSLTGVTDNTCTNPVPNGNTTFERLEQFNSSIVTGLIAGKETCYVPDGVLGNAKADINHFFNRSNYNNTVWTDGTACAFDRNVSTKAQEFIVNFTNESFFLFMYLGTPDCSGHVGGDNSNNYNNSFIEVNHALGILLDTLRDQSIENTTAIVITADHGWNEGTTGHSTFNSDTAIIPLITNNRSIINNASTDNSREQCDIAPTILDYFGMPATNYSDILNNGCSSMFDPLFSPFGVSGCATINASTTLTTNIQATGSGTCFTLNANNIDFDCRSFSMNGSNGTGEGISVGGFANVTIRNCVVENFSTGIELIDTNTSQVVNVTSRNVTQGIRLSTAIHNTVANSYFRGNNRGVQLDTGAFNNTIANSTLVGITFAGITVDDSDNNTFVNNTAIAEGANSGIFLTSGSDFNTLVNNTANSTSGPGIMLTSSSNNTLVNNTARSHSSSAALQFAAGSNNNTFVLTTLNAPNTWLTIAAASFNNNFTQTVFSDPNGSIKLLPNINLSNGTSLAHSGVRVNYNEAFLDSVTLPYLNRSAEIVLRGLGVTVPRILRDPEDDGTYVDCPASICAQLSYAGGVLVFNVTQFTTYAGGDNATNLTACAVVNTSATLVQNIFANTTCFTLNASNIVFNCAGFSITGNATGDGIAVADNRVNVTIRDCTVRNFDRGIRFTSVNSSVIQNSSGLNATTDGISLGASHFNIIANSTGVGSSGAGIRVETGTFNNLTNVSGNSDTASGVLVDSSPNTTVRDSWANSTSGTAAWYVSSSGTTQIINTTGVSVGGNGIRIDSGGAVLVANSTGGSNSAAGILLTSADYTLLIDSTGASNQSNGISLGTNTNATNVTGISNTSQGILFSSATDAVVRNSRAVSNSSTGLLFSSATGSTAINVTATSATAAAIAIGSGSANRLINSSGTSASGTGLLIEFSTHNNISGNTFSGNNIGVLLTGVFAGVGAINNTITGGVISGNAVGVGLTGFSEENRIENLTLLSNTRAGVQLNESTRRNVVRNVTFAGNLFGILYLGGNNNTVLNSTVNGTRAAINVTANGYNNSIANASLELNATFEFSNNITGPTILIFPIRLNFTTPVRFADVLAVKSNNVTVNGSVSALNRTAHIIMHNTFIKPNATYDPEEDGVFIACPASVCTLLSQASGRLHFSVTGFTAYGSNETGPLNISNTTIVSNATFNGSRNSTLGGVIGDAFGFAVGAGDFNNDTIKDHVFGAPFVPDNLAITATGKVYVVYGQNPVTPSMNVTEVTANITIRGPTNNGSAQLGRAVAAGDLNGDLIDDLVYAVPGIHQIGVLFGAHGLGNVRPRFNETNFSVNVSSLIDVSLAVADFNNDSIADLAVGQPDFSIFDNETNGTFQGRVDVLYGRASWPSFLNLSQNANVTLTGTVAGDRFGFAVAAGDVNGDGVKDLVASAPRRNVSGVAGVGTAYVFFGGALFLSEPALAADAILEGESFAFGVSQVNASTGFALFANGDVNNDSIADILVGAPNLAVDSPIEYDAGATYVVFGRSSLAGTFNLSAANATLYGVFGSASPGGVPGGERAGFALFARDVTNDSTDDVFIGAPMADTNGVADAGIVYLVYGLQSWPRFLNLTQANRSFADLLQNSSFGWSLANGSVLVGAPDLDAQRSPVSGLFEASSGNAFPGLGIGHAYDIGSPGAPDTTTTISTTTTTTTTLPSGSGGGSGGGTTGGGSRGVFYSCRSNQNGEPGAQFYGVEAGLGQWHSCDDYYFWNSFTTRETYLGGKITEAYTTCCECTTKKRCDHVKGAIVVEEVPKPPCRGLIKSFPCGQPVGTFTPGSGFPYTPADIQQDLDKCCSCEEMAKYFGGCDDTPTPPGGVNVQEFAAAHQRYLEKCCQKPTYCPLPEMECYPKAAPFKGVEFRWFWPPNECPEHSVQIPCESIDDAGALGTLEAQAPGLFSDADIAAGAEQCCKKKVCPKDRKHVDVECRKPPAKLVEITTEVRYDKECRPQSQAITKDLGDCTVTKPKNNCWTRKPTCKEGKFAIGPGGGFAFCDKEDTFIGDKRCQAAAPTADDAFQSGTQAQNGCAVQLAPTGGGGPQNILFTFPADCDKDCQLQCPPCLPGKLMQLFQGLVPVPLWIGPTNTGPFLPMNLIKCASETIVPPAMVCVPGSADSACLPPAPACAPGSSDPACTTPQPCPPGSADPACSSPVPDDCAAKGACPQPCRNPPCGSIDVDSPAPFPTPTPEPVVTIVPAPKPQITVEDTQPQVYCAAASPDGAEEVSLSPAAGIDDSRLPPGYELIATVGVECAGKALDVTLNIPDNFKDVRSFLMTPDDAKSLPSQLAQVPQCGGAWAQQIRQQQGAESAYGVDYRELTSIVEKSAIISPSAEQQWVQSGAYRVEFLNPAQEGIISVRLSAPPFDVPAPKQVSLVIVGTPLWLHVDQIVSGSVRATLPFSIPEHVDPASATIAVMIDGKWVPLTTEINALDATATAVLDDIAPALNADGNALFAVMGLYCANCLDVVLEKAYDGGSRKAVLLIPGFTTDRFRFQLFIDDLTRANSDWQVWIAGYPTSMPSADVAREVSAQLEQHASEFNSISLVTHSVGGFSAQRALEDARSRGFSWSRKAQDVIMAGQPGLGSPAEAYRELFNVLVNLKTTSSLFSKSLLLDEATDGLQVPRAPNAEYFIIAGRQTYPFTASLFKDASGVYQPNDGIVSIYSARTVGGKQITDTCKHYFEVPRTHTDLFDDWLPRKVMQRALFRKDAAQRPDEAIAGYNAFVRVSDPDCQPGTLVVVGKRIADAATADPLLCNCGNNVCGEGENELNCPQDCATGYKYTYLCRFLPWVIGPMIALLLLLTAVYVYGAERRHERGSGAFWISSLASVIFLLIVGLYVFCGFTMPLGVLVLTFVIALLAFTIGHLRGTGKGGLHIDDSSAQKLEELLRRARLP